MKNIIAISIGLLCVMSFVLVTFGATPQVLVNPCIYTSSFTLTDDSQAIIDDVTWLHAVVVSSASAGGYIQLYDREGATPTTSLIGVVDLGTLNTYLFDCVVSSGLTYNTSGNAGGVTILYR